ncbi:MAG: inorganic phosphate transporter [Candidatus Latescibacter sp.]|nr:inorganic phosphate transporter [Candidatus Latescibacter sp.]
MISISFLVILVILLALVFDFLNGFHDAANSIATVVVTRTLTPLQAVILAGMANFIGYFTFGHAIAKMVSKGIINLDMLPTPDAKLTLLLGALVGAIIWNIFTWLLGLPTSSSHALIGGLIGAGLASSGPDMIIIGSIAIHAGKLSVTGILPIIVFIIIAPLLGMIGATAFILAILNLFKKMPYYHSAKLFKYLQLISATWFSVGHGTNDAQKMMGVISLALFSGGMANSLEIQPWVAFACYASIGLGTMFGGWRIVKTMGTKITKIRATEGFCAESSAALVLMGTAHFGIPVSTTHVISGAIMGVGTVENIRAVRWGTARKIVWAWFMTIPMAALCSAAAYRIISLIH